MIGTVVVGTDGSETARKALQEAAELAAGMGASVQVVSAYTPVTKARQRDDARDMPGDLQHRITGSEDADGILEEAKELLTDAGVATVGVHAREGDPAAAILAVAEELEADVIVVGNKGMTGTKRFLLGSVPDKISHHAPCSVLIVRTT